MNELLELAERCEKATGPYRDIDRDIWMVLNPHQVKDWHAPNGVSIHGYAKHIAPKYTASIDAAMTLVPEGFYIELRRHSDGWYCWIAEHSTFRNATLWICTQKPAPLALCAAALRARSALQPSSGERT